MGLKQSSGTVRLSVWVAAALFLAAVVLPGSLAAPADGAWGHDWGHVWDGSHSEEDPQRSQPMASGSLPSEAPQEGGYRHLNAVEEEEVARWGYGAIHTGRMRELLQFSPYQVGSVGSGMGLAHKAAISHAGA